MISDNDLLKKEMVNNPSHYGGKDNPYEVIKVIDAWDLDFNLGNAIKYIPRAGEKLYPGKTKLESEIVDLKKSAWYLNHKIELLEAQRKKSMIPKLSNEESYTTEEEMRE